MMLGNIANLSLVLLLHQYLCIPDVLYENTVVTKKNNRFQFLGDKNTSHTGPYTGTYSKM